LFPPKIPRIASNATKYCTENKNYTPKRLVGALLQT
jgi:hypothetical protein